MIATGEITLLRTYILLKPGVSQAAFDAKIKNVTIDHTKGTAILQQRRYLHNLLETNGCIQNRRTESMLAAELKW